jgi:lathosterol oxidase
VDTILNTILALFVVQRVGFAELFRLPLANGLVIALAFLLIHVIFRGSFRRRKIQRGAVDPRILLHEFFFTSTTLMLGGAIGMFTIYLLQRRVAVIEYGETTLLTVLGQSLLYLLLFDLYFYAVHRVLHVGIVYDWVHKVHHRSMMPNPLTAFSVHPIEALLTGGFTPLALTLFHFHLYAVTLVSVHGTVNSILLHTGHEVFPRWWYTNRISRWFVTPSFHDAHHSEIGGNYAIITTFWDRAFGTMQPHFEREFALARPQALGTAAG